MAHDQLIAKVDVFGRHSFAAGTPEQAPFSIVVPGDAGPSSAYPHAQVDWRLEAVLDRRLRGDFDVSVPLVVV